MTSWFMIHCNSLFIVHTTSHNTRHNEWINFNQPSLRFSLLFKMIVIISLLLLAAFTIHISKKIIHISSKCLTQYRANNLKDKLSLQNETHKNLALSYTPTNCSSLDHFNPSKMRSPCLFARQAQLWGSCEYNRNQSITQNMIQNIPALCKFVSLAEDKDQNQQALDGFLIEIRGGEYCDTVASFAATVRTALTALGQHDPSGLDTMHMKSIGTSSWYFSFNMVPLFVTTFAPCYPPSSARHLHPATTSLPATEEDSEHDSGSDCDYEQQEEDDEDRRHSSNCSSNSRNSDSCDSSSNSRPSDSCFILLQPEVSFARHGIGPDNPSTNWEKPQTIRDKIRVSFRDKEQSYHIPSTLRYPVAATFVHSEEGKSHSVSFWDKLQYPDHHHNIDHENWTRYVIEIEQILIN